jgi:hypothetical protein
VLLLPGGLPLQAHGLLLLVLLRPAVLCTLYMLWAGVWCI